MYEFRIIVGDWSNDGHGRSTEVLIQCSHPVEQVQQAYKDSSRLTGLTFDGNAAYTGLTLNWDHPEREARQLAVEYEDNIISKLAEDILKTHGLDIRDEWEYMREHPEEELYFDGVAHFVKILMEFIKLSLPDMKWTNAEQSKPPVFNGYWDKNLNITIGYGLFN